MIAEQSLTSQENENTNDQECKTDEDLIEQLPPKEPDKIGIIYGIIDPRYGIIRYGGETTWTKEKRLQQHITMARSKKHNNKRISWIRKLLHLKLEPIIVVLRKNIPVPFITYLQNDLVKDGLKRFKMEYDFGELDKEEKLFISAIRRRCVKFGVTCVNSTDGGGGSFGFRMSEETKRKISEMTKGRKLSPEHIQHMREGHRGQVSWCKGKHLSEEHKKHMSEGKIGTIPWNKGKRSPKNNQKKPDKRHSPEFKEAIRKRNIGKKHSPETREKLSTKNKGQIPWNQGEKLSSDHKKKIGEKSAKTHQRRMIAEWT